MPGVCDEDGISIVTEHGALKLEFVRDWHGAWSASVVGQEPVPITWEMIQGVAARDLNYVVGNTVTLPYCPYGLSQTISISLTDADLDEVRRLLSVYNTRYLSTVEGLT